MLSENARIWLIQALLQASRSQYLRNFLNQTIVNLQDAAQSDDIDSDSYGDDEFSLGRRQMPEAG